MIFRAERPEGVFPMDTAIDLTRHPCFNEEAKGVCGRIHLPVAPKCNIKCNYCDRKYDCVNESRPGVSSAVLEPRQALSYFREVVAREPSITVVGIAGPGDPLANPEETFETMAGIRREFPGMLFCLSTNGLALPQHVGKIASLGVSHVTVTVNAVNPEIGQRIYAFVKDGKFISRGREAAELLWDRQREGIKALKERGVIVKVNTILIPGVNEDHVEEVAKTMAAMGVDILNVMAMVPNAGTPFGELGEPGPEMIAKARDAAGNYLPQMRHCQRCRADAVGLLGCDKSREFADLLASCAEELYLETEGKPHVAVATREGLLVNQHLGEAESFQVWGEENGNFMVIETRAAPPKGGGIERWRDLADILSDCRAVLVSGFGEIPNGIMTAEGVPPLEVSGFISLALEAIYNRKSLKPFRRQRSGGCRKNFGCGGDGGGCG